LSRRLIVGCCARASSGHAAAPSPAMNSRRRIHPSQGSATVALRPLRRQHFEPSSGAFGERQRPETDGIRKLVKTENCTSLGLTEWQIPQYSSGLAPGPRRCVSRHRRGVAAGQELCLWICFLINLPRLWSPSSDPDPRRRTEMTFDQALEALKDAWIERCLSGGSTRLNARLLAARRLIDSHPEFDRGRYEAAFDAANRIVALHRRILQAWSPGQVQ
jgi:hypothetical protein